MLHNNDTSDRQVVDSDHESQQPCIPPDTDQRPHPSKELDGARFEVVQSKQILTNKQRFYVRYGFGRRLLAPPFMWCNIFFATLFLGIFVAMSYFLISDYVGQVRNPPLTNSVRHVTNSDPRFPNLVACSTIPTVPLEDVVVIVEQKFGSTLVSSGSKEMPKQAFYKPYESTDWKRVNGTILDTVVKRVGVRSCVGVDATPIPGFHTSETLGALVPNRVSLLANINASSLPDQPRVVQLLTPAIGMELYTVNTFDEFLKDDWVPGESTPDNLLVGVGQVNSVNMQKIETRTLDANESFDSHNFRVSSVPANPEYFDLLSITLSLDLNANDTVYTFFQYSEYRVQQYKETVPSFATFFGSWGGWIGLMSDGWGLMSVLFIFEKMLLRQCFDAKSYLWWIPAQDKFYDTKTIPQN